MKDSALDGGTSEASMVAQTPIQSILERAPDGKGQP